MINRQVVSIVIMSALQKKEPMLRLDKEDHGLLKMCINDFWHYVGYLDRNYQILKDEEVEQHRVMQMSVVGGIVQVRVVNPVPKEVVEFVEGWVGWWWKKYKQRVKVVLGDKPMDKLAIVGNAILKRHFTKKEEGDILMKLTDTLIKHGEICCGRILAKSLFHSVLGRTRRSRWKMEDKLNFLGAVTTEARRVTRITGALIFIRPDKNYYRLREYRDSGGKIV